MICQNCIHSEVCKHKTEAVYECEHLKKKNRQATQLLYHLIRNVKYSKNTSKALKKICRIKSLVKQANNFHRVNECGVIESEVDTE